MAQINNLPNTPKTTLTPLGRGAVQTGQKIAAIRQMVSDSLSHPIVAAEAYRLTSSTFDRDPMNILRTVHDFVLRSMTYKPDPYGVELFTSPRVLLERIQVTGRAEGDCDDMVLLESGLLRALKFPVRVVLGWTPSNFRDTPDHIFLEAEVKGVWVSLEPTAPQRPIGWRGDFRRTEAYSL